MKVEIKDGNIIITTPINKPLMPSKSGKTLLVASSNGNITSEAVIEGKHIVIGLNCYIAR
jgi:hypothetical protein